MPLPPLLPGRRLATAIAAALGAALTVGAGCVGWVRTTTAGYTYSAESVPPAPVALVLGKLVYPDGTPSPLLRARLELAATLYRAGKVRAVLVSGDGGSRPGYDEVAPMRRWLIEHGVPARRIVSDPAGFDTYASCARARSVFGVSRAIVVTNSYHLPRALALCRHSGIDAIGVGDETGRSDWWSWWTGTAREQPATVLAVYDMLVHRKPPGPYRPSPSLAAALAPD